MALNNTFFVVVVVVVVVVIVVIVVVAAAAVAVVVVCLFACLHFIAICFVFVEGLFCFGLLVVVLFLFCF